MAQDGFDFNIWSGAAFSIQKEMSIDSSDHSPLKDTQGLLVCNSQGPGFSSPGPRSILYSVILVSLERRCGLSKICMIPCRYSLGHVFLYLVFTVLLFIYLFISSLK